MTAKEEAHQNRLDRLPMAQAVVAHVYGIGLDELLAPCRHRPRAAHARQVAMYLAHTVLHLNLAEIARAFGRDRNAARHACRRVEAQRENRDVDRTLAWLETLVRAAAGAAA